MTRAMRIGLTLGAIVAVTLPAADALARTETLRWTHTAPGSVDFFRIYWGTQDGVYSNQQDVGIPPTDSQGAFVSAIQVPDADTAYVVITAWGSGLESSNSNQGVRAGTAPPPPPPTASSAINGFALWDASDDSILDGNFTSGESIDVGDHDCTALEVLGNGYLAQVGSPGSVRLDLDGQVSCVDELPYSIGAPEGSDAFSCAPELAQGGNLTLTATPFDADGCVGLAGAAARVTFDVNVPPPVTSAPGQPGQPQLILD